MTKLSEECKKMIGEIHPGIIATADKSGKPNVSVKGSFRVLDDEHVIFGDIFSPRTVANLRENPQVCAMVLDTASRKGCRIWGKAEIIDSGETLDKMNQEFAAMKMKVNHVVRIKVEEVKEQP